MPWVTIHDVAQTTATRVRQAIDDLGYESSLVARSLRSNTTNVIGILVAEFEPFSAEILHGASATIAGTGYELLAYSGGGRAGNDVGWERRYLSRLGGHLIDGAILVTPTVVDADSPVPVVAIDPHPGPSGPPTVDSTSPPTSRRCPTNLRRATAGGSDEGRSRLATAGVNRVRQVETSRRENRRGGPSVPARSGPSAPIRRQAVLTIC